MPIKTTLKYLLVWQILILTVTYISASILPLRESYLGGGTQTYLRNPFLYSRANFDGVHYVRIAQNGYGYAQQAFFPMYPNLIRQLQDVFSSPELAGVVISLVSFYNWDMFPSKTPAFG